MKRILIILITSLLLIVTACGDGDGAENTSATNKKENENTTEKNNDGEIPVYQIGETAVIKNDKFDLEYEVTVNDFEISKEINGVKEEELVANADPEDDGGFLAVEVTYKNISDEAYVPNERFYPVFQPGDGGGGELTDYDDMFFPELEKELAPGEEITGKLVYLSAAAIEDYFTLTYEPMQENETWFHLPNPNLN
ncbi:hypothetical protein HNQ35_002683 [Cerasibacillus quisquiliarum]|uniref:DUF4352 domain-containing protein n=2 Tax=Cerasibacillus quisquiliarum TaxID=227865 RepID=UPI00161448C7|nr:DUF4352 domain-containing protein [Cerasibacillus quisquiliarum]MBB5147454.1 hypothetical protein [Cerasibacillus quisquiliarum]